MDRILQSEFVTDLNSVAQGLANLALERIVVCALVATCVLAVVLILRKQLSAHAKSWLWLLPLITLVIPLERALPGIGVREKLNFALPQSVASTQVAPPKTELQPRTPTARDSKGSAVAPTQVPGAHPATTMLGASSMAASQPLKATRNSQVDRSAGDEASATTSESESFPWAAVISILWLSVSLALLLRWREKHANALHALRATAHSDPTLTEELRLALEARTQTDMPWLQRVTCPPIDIAYRAELNSPATLPGPRPLILLPLSLATTVPPSQRQWIIHHELAHVLRGDLWIMMAQKLIQMLWWWNPLMVLIVRELEHQRECACDDVATAMIGGRQRAGAHALIAVMTNASQQTLSLPAFASLLHPRSRTRRRFMRLVRDRGPMAPGLSGFSRIAIILLGATALAAARPAQQALTDQGPRVVAAADVQVADHETDRPGGTIPQEVEPTHEEMARKLVAGASAWLVKHQDAKGAWKIATHEKKYEVGIETRVSITARATLALLDATRFLGPNRNRDAAAARGIAWLTAREDKDGCIGARAGSAWAFGHMMAIQAFAQEYSLRPTPELKATVQAAIDFVAEMQNPYMGWRYGVRDGDNDSKMTSLTLVAVQAAARMGVTNERINVGWANDFLQSVTDPETGRVGWMKRGEGAGRLFKHNETHPGDMSEENTALAAVQWLESGKSPANDRALQRAIAVVFGRMPLWNMRKGTVDYEYWYWGSRMMSHLDGWQWEAWKSAIEATLFDRASLRLDGTVTWPLDDAWSKKGLEVYATARNLRTLVVTHGPRLPRFGQAQRKK